LRDCIRVLLGLGEVAIEPRLPIHESRTRARTFTARAQNFTHVFTSRTLAERQPCEGRLEAGL
jgi:hypothetical protein